MAQLLSQWRNLCTSVVISLEIELAQDDDDDDNYY